MCRVVFFLPMASQRLCDIWSRTKGHGERFLLRLDAIFGRFHASFQPQLVCIFAKKKKGSSTSSDSAGNMKNAPGDDSRPQRLTIQPQPAATKTWTN